MSRLHIPPSRVVAAIPRPSTGETIRVSLLGHQPTHCDVRVFGATRNSRGEPLPTRTGICIRLEQLGELIAALQAAQREGGR